MGYTEKEIATALQVYNQEIEDVIKKEKDILLPHIVESIKRQKDKLPGVQFSTGNIDDMYEIERVEDDTLVLFQTWDFPAEEEFEEMEITELSFEQMKEVFYELENK